jgi:hypothetical protein
MLQSCVHIRTAKCPNLSLFNVHAVVYDTRMAGLVLGRYFKLVVRPLLAAQSGHEAQKSELQARMAAMEDEQEVAWDEFAAAVARASSGVHERDQAAIGERIIGASKGSFERWGFDSAESMLADLDAPFGALILDPPEHERLTTAKFEPGYAVFCIGTAHPAALLRGYLRGIVEVHGGTVHALACHLVQMDGQPYHLLEMRWCSPVVVARPRVGSGPRMVA